MTALDYINEYSARKSPFSMTPPWRYHNPIVRAFYWKREAWLQLEILDGLGRDRDQSHSRDIASDAYDFAREQHRSAIQAGWDLRAMERGNPVPPKGRVDTALAAMERQSNVRAVA